MSDFAQQGLICTLQRLAESHESEIERSLAEWPVALVLPCHAADLARPAILRILDELTGAEFLSEIVISVNGSAEIAPVRELFSRLPQPCRIIWNDGPRLSELWRRESIPAGGKGRNVWAAFGLLIAEGRAGIVVTQDCDVTTFRRGTLARLCYAAAAPQLGYEFSKMYYSRVAGRMFGRVSRLFLAPFLQALVRAAGHHPLLDFLSSFRYPLAGECALTRGLAGAVSLGAGWDLEIGLLCEVFRRTAPRNVCQVDGGSDYDHKHQPLVDEQGGGLVAMTRSIARTLLHQLSREGLAVDAGFLQALVAAYQRETIEAIRRSRHLALINGLAFDEEAEQRVGDAFTGGLRQVAQEGAAIASPALPVWNRLTASRPDFVREFCEAIAADNR